MSADPPSPQLHGRDFLSLAVFLGLCFLAAGVGGAITASAVGSPESWYAGLAKPPWNPPDWVFGPVWTVLYAMMAVAAWLVWRRAGAGRRLWPMLAFGVQLALNVAWSGLFFGLHRPDLAVLGIALLWAAIAATLALFWPHSRAAALLLAPYLAWVSFAAVLNVVVWQLNAV
jgi:benzodiazapine receptor